MRRVVRKKIPLAKKKQGSKYKLVAADSGGIMGNVAKGSTMKDAMDGIRKQINNGSICEGKYTIYQLVPVASLSVEEPQKLIVKIEELKK